MTQQPGEAGLKAVTITLPLSLALDPDNAESDSLCEYLDGLRNQCPAKSVIGTVTAISPLLKAPLNGKVYFVKGVRTDPKTGRQIRTLPTLLIELRGEVNVNLRQTNSVPDNKHLTATFPNIPDAPISSFSLKLNGGKKADLCIQRPSGSGWLGLRHSDAGGSAPRVSLGLHSPQAPPGRRRTQGLVVGPGAWEARRWGRARLWRGTPTRPCVDRLSTGTTFPEGEGGRGRRPPTKTSGKSHKECDAQGVRRNRSASQRGHTEHPPPKHAQGPRTSPPRRLAKKG